MLSEHVFDYFNLVASFLPRYLVKSETGARVSDFDSVFHEVIGVLAAACRWFGALFDMVGIGEG